MKGTWHLIGALIYFLIGISPEKGARTMLHLATSPEVAEVSGKYFVKSRDVPSSRLSYDANLRRRLWEESERLIQERQGAEG